MLKFYKGFLGNFHPSKIFIYGRWWKNVEAPYQSMKSLYEEDRILIWNAKTAKEARDLGQQIRMHEGWDNDKYRVMYECIFAKFAQNPDLCDQLMDTGDKTLVEDSPIDYYWGCGADGSGKNKLGEVLMEVRKLLDYKSLFIKRNGS